MTFTINQKFPGSSDLDDESSPPKIEKRMPLSPIKNNEPDEGYDEPIKKTVKKKLFGDAERKIETPKKSRSKTNADFAKIKARLSLENPGIILGREKEQSEVEYPDRNSFLEVRQTIFELCLVPVQSLDGLQTLKSLEQVTHREVRAHRKLQGGLNQEKI